MNAKSSCRLTAVFTLSALLFGCDGSSGGGSGPDPASGAALQAIEYGRLVNIFAYQRVDPTKDDRRNTLNRVPTLIAKEVLVQPGIATDPLFDATGNARLDANYRFLPFDVSVGHDELLILWDDRIPPEKARFEEAMRRATTGLPTVTNAYRGQDTAKRPIPVVPRNAAIRLSFSQDLKADTAFFTAQPSAVQLLEFITPLGSTGKKFRPVPSRVLARGDKLIIDTSLIGGEVAGGRNSDGMPPSPDNHTANLRIALPTVGVVAKQLRFAEDGVAELNDIDSNGDPAVIRDFRSGNLQDGEVGALADLESPMVVAHLKMGIMAADLQNRVLTINKRNLDAPLRGRIPYVDGALDPVTGRALGPVAQPLQHPLRSGDIIRQTVLSPTGEAVVIRAEIVMNLDVGNSVDDPEFVGLGMFRTSSDPQRPADGGQDPFVRVKVNEIGGVDSDGNPVTFRASTLPLGEDCEARVHYYENVPYAIKYAGALSAVSDRGRAHHFLLIDPQPPALDANRNPNQGGLVSPTAAIALRFSEPMNRESIALYENYMLSNAYLTASNLLPVLGQPKPSSLSMLATRLLDAGGDGTVMQLRPLLGHFHRAGSEEQYWFHMVLGAKGPTDMSGNPVDLFDHRLDRVRNFSIGYTLDKDAADNNVGYRVHRFIAQDEDGTAPGSADFFGQFQLFDGELRALPATRRSLVADLQILQGITRFERGECDFKAAATTNPPVPEIPAQIAPFLSIPGILYQCPSMVAPPGGGMTEPHNPNGSRMQMTYREDDFGLSYREPSDHMIDIEQMHWAPWNDSEIRFDTFDRYTLRLAHCDWRPDLTYFAFLPPGQTTPVCGTDCFSGRSGLRPDFDSNVLEGTSYTTVVKDRRYEMNPNDAFRGSTGTKFLPYPQFDKTFTWRDPRLIQWDTPTQTARGFGGAHEPASQSLSLRDTTSSCSSPYVPDKVPADFERFHTNTEFVMDYGDHLGFFARDHSPLFLPLLMDFAIFPDGPANQGVALGKNEAHAALVGPCWPLSGYYSTGGITGCPLGQPWPEMRAHASGGKDLITGNPIYVEPETAATARASNIKDVLLGNPGNDFLFVAPPLDDHLHWARVDLVRRVSMVTFGFFDALRPNAHDFKNPRNALETPEWPGAARDNTNGLPNLAAIPQMAGISDFVSVMEPPLSEQPIGTSVVVEYRVASDFDNDDTIFNEPDDGSLNWSSHDIVKKRGNLLNPFYACEAYRYALIHAFDAVSVYNVHAQGWLEEPRVTASGLTEYVTEDRLDSLRQANGLLPRFINYRFVMSNNLTASPPVSPTVRSFAVAFRSDVDG